MSIAIDYEDDWYTRLLKKLYVQFRGASSWQLFCRLLADQFQDLEDSAQTLLSVYDIDNSSGVQLDTIGRIIGQVRTVADDATYRVYLKARVLANKSEGTPEQIYGVFTALLGAVGFLFIQGGPKQFVLKVIGAITDAQAAAAVVFLGAAKEAGARGIVEWQESPTAALFTFNGTAAQGFNAGVFANARQA